jgi:hypothetical protein
MSNFVLYELRYNWPTKTAQFRLNTAAFVERIYTSTSTASFHQAHLGMRLAEKSLKSVRNSKAFKLEIESPPLPKAVSLNI